MHGYAWTSAGDIAGASIFPETFEAGGDLCVTGTTAADYSSAGILGVNVGQGMTSTTNEGWTPTGSGLNVNVTNSGGTSLRVQLHTSSNDYCADLSAGANAVAWSSLMTECWEGGTHNAFNGTDTIINVWLLVPGMSEGAVSYSFCLNSLTVY
jgi:hypothetical protein